MIHSDFQNGTAFNGVPVTAPGKARQYNTITEKYVNNAVRENEKTNITVVNPINEEEIDTHYPDQHNVEHIRLTIDGDKNNYIVGGINNNERQSLRMDEENEKRIVSHAEKHHEHFKVNCPFCTLYIKSTRDIFFRAMTT